MRVKAHLQIVIDRHQAQPADQGHDPDGHENGADHAHDIVGEIEPVGREGFRGGGDVADRTGAGGVQADAGRPPGNVAPAEEEVPGVFVHLVLAVIIVADGRREAEVEDDDRPIDRLEQALVQADGEEGIGLEALRVARRDDEAGRRRLHGLQGAGNREGADGGPGIRDRMIGVEGGVATIVHPESEHMGLTAGLQCAQRCRRVGHAAPAVLIVAQPGLGAIGGVGEHPERFVAEKLAARRQSRGGVGEFRQRDGGGDGREVRGLFGGNRRATQGNLGVDRGQTSPSQYDEEPDAGAAENRGHIPKHHGSPC